jgi:hypothetical protein
VTNIYKLYRLHPVVCIVSYGYDCQHNNKAEYVWMKTNTDVDQHLFLSSPEHILLYCCVGGHNHKILYIQQDAIYNDFCQFVCY